MQTTSESFSFFRNEPSFIFRVRLCVFATLLLTGGVLKGFGADDSAPPPDKYSLPWEKGSVKFGGFVAAFDSTLGFGLSGGPSVEVKGEDGLGLDSSLTVLRVDALFRPGESRRHQLDFTYAAYHRDSTRTLSEDIDLGDQTLQAGSEVSTIFNFDIIRGTYSYAILQDDRMRVALGLGIYAVPVEYGLKVAAPPPGGRSEVEGADITLPLPALAFRAEFQLIPKLFLSLESNFMYIKLNGFEGSLVDNTIGLEYRPCKYFGLGLAYSGLSVSVEQNDIDSNYPGANFIGNVDVRYNGLLLYGKLAF